MTIPRQRSPQQAFRPPAHKRLWRTLWRRCSCGHLAPCPSTNKQSTLAAAVTEAGSEPTVPFSPPPRLSSPPHLSRPHLSQPHLSQPRLSQPRLSPPPGLSPPRRRPFLERLRDDWRPTPPVSQDPHPDPVSADTQPRPGENTVDTGTCATETPHGWQPAPESLAEARHSPPTPAPAFPPRPQTAFPHLSPPTFSPANEEYGPVPRQSAHQSPTHSAWTRQQSNPQRASPTAHQAHRPRHGTAPLLHRIHTHSALEPSRVAGMPYPIEGPTTADAHTRPLTAVRPRDRAWVTHLPAGQVAYPRTFPAQPSEQDPLHAPRPGDESAISSSWNAPTMPLTQIGRAGGLTPAQAFRADRGPA